MREILFRGKDIAGNWYAGNLAVVKQDIHNGAGTIKAGSYISNEYGLPFAYQIRPETVSQFTGILDKNGKKIFEEDVVRIGSKNYLIEWNKFTAGFIVKYYARISDLHMDMYEVIGNIHDNPELLEAR